MKPLTLGLTFTGSRQIGARWVIIFESDTKAGQRFDTALLLTILASLVMITGYSIIAVPTGIFTAELTQALRQEGRLLHDCPNCGKAAHERSASFCSRCGSLLFPTRPADSGP